MNVQSWSIWQYGGKRLIGFLLLHLTPNTISGNSTSKSRSTEKDLQSGTSLSSARSLSSIAWLETHASWSQSQCLTGIHSIYMSRRCIGRSDSVCSRKALMTCFVDAYSMTKALCQLRSSSGQRKGHIVSCIWSSRSPILKWLGRWSLTITCAHGSTTKQLLTFTCTMMIVDSCVQSTFISRCTTWWCAITSCLRRRFLRQKQSRDKKMKRKMQLSKAVKSN